MRSIIRVFVPGSVLTDRTGIIVTSRSATRPLPEGCPLRRRLPARASGAGGGWGALSAPAGWRALDVPLRGGLGVCRRGARPMARAATPPTGSVAGGDRRWAGVRSGARPCQPGRAPLAWAGSVRPGARRGARTATPSGGLSARLRGARAATPIGLLTSTTTNKKDHPSSHLPKEKCCRKQYGHTPTGPSPVSTCSSPSTASLWQAAHIAPRGLAGWAAGGHTAAAPI